VNLVGFVFMSMQYITCRLTTYYDNLVKQLTNDLGLFQSRSLSQNGRLNIQIPPFSKKRLIIPRKYVQVLSISNKMADYSAFPLLL
jgi:hypothetical protein